VTPDEHYTAAEQILAELRDPASPPLSDQEKTSLSDQEKTWALMEAQTHATLATVQPTRAVLPDQPPTDAELRNALLDYELTHERDPYGARTRLVHLLAYIEDDSEREEWITRAAAVSNNSVSAYRRWIKVRR
jgi:hypothetical protein